MGGKLFWLMRELNNQREMKTKRDFGGESCCLLACKMGPQDPEAQPLNLQRNANYMVWGEANS